MWASSWVKWTHADQPVQLARLLVAVDRAPLGQPHRQIAIAAQRVGVDLDVAGQFIGFRPELPFSSSVKYMFSR